MWEQNALEPGLGDDIEAAAQHLGSWTDNQRITATTGVTPVGAGPG